ncbi:hypothetical protein D1871_02895 [Nakamurella silvestris]|nr:hypothetical protein D1871_02895 [Nakamurella silvestris]
MTEQVGTEKPGYIAWIWPELLLAGTLLAENIWQHPREHDPRVKELSDLLRSANLHPRDRRPEKFRSTGSVSRKITDIQTQAASYHGSKTRGNKLDREIAERFLAEPDRMINEAWAIRQAIVAGTEGQPLPAAPQPSLSDPLADGLDTRKKVLAERVQRIGQAGFRSRLMSAYDGKCAVSENGVVEVLQAAHIKPYLGPDTNGISNGLLLRSDLHLLFDSNLLAFDRESRTRLHPRIKLSREYRELEGVRLRPPRDPENEPSPDALVLRYQLSIQYW